MRRLALVLVIIALLTIGLSACGDDDDPVAEQGASISGLVMKAWETGDQADIDAVYAPNVKMILDQDTLAENREEISSLISQAMDIGNSYQQVGPVSTYTGIDGDLYIGTTVEVQGSGHPRGAPLMGFYRVQDGQEIRHVFIEAEAY